MSRSILATAAVLVSLISAPARAQSESAVMEWNRIAVAATVTAGLGPIPQIRSMTIVQVAVHDAVNAITCDYRTYLLLFCGPWGSPEAAAIGAAHQALVQQFPNQAQALNDARAASLAAHGVSANDPGLAVGRAIASFIGTLRADDGASQAQFPYTAPGAGEKPGVWVNENPAPAQLPGWGKVRLWVVRNLEPFRPEGPPELFSRRYARDYNEVKELGSKTSTARTGEQTEIARFWLGSPTAIWNGVARQVIQAEGLSPAATARAFALLYLAASDASIACWEAKYTHNFWRPLTAIRNGDVDDNPRTEAQADWEPLFPTPPHPEYLSGHSTNSSAMAQVLIQLFGDKRSTPIVATSPTNAGFERHWTRLSEGVDEVIEARIYSGIHYRSADEDGAQVGRRIARVVVDRALRRRQ
jgi:hypothetical protein